MELWNIAGPKDVKNAWWCEYLDIFSNEDVCLGRFVAGWCPPERASRRLHVGRITKCEHGPEG
jgi:hypothetical protein